MLKGPRGEKRPADLIGNAVRAMRQVKVAVLRREARLGLEEARAGKFSRKTVADIAASVLARAGKKA